MKELKNAPWGIIFFSKVKYLIINLSFFNSFYFIVPTQKMPRLLPTSATACRKLLHKAKMMGIDTVALEMQDAQVILVTKLVCKLYICFYFDII